MTIFIYSGTPGSGKSYHMIYDVYHACKRGKSVIGNFEVNSDEDWTRNFTYVPNSRLTADYIVSFAVDYWAGREFEEDGLLLCVDEAQLLYNSRTWGDSDRMAMLELMSQSRKYGLKIILVAQSDMMIDKQFRALVEYEVFHRKVANVGVFGRLISALTFSTWFVCITTYYQMKNVKLSSDWMRYTDKYGKLYNTRKTFDMAGARAHALAPGVAGSGRVVGSTAEFSSFRAKIGSGSDVMNAGKKAVNGDDEQNDHKRQASIDCESGRRTLPAVANSGCDAQPVG